MLRNVLLLRRPAFALQPQPTPSAPGTRHIRTAAAAGALRQLQHHDLSANFTHTAAEGFVRRNPFAPIGDAADQRIDQFVWRDLARWQQRTAIVCGDTGRQLTYAQLRDHCAATAVRLQRQLALRRDDVVAVCLPNCPDFAIACLGALEAELVVTTVNPIYTAGE